MKQLLENIHAKKACVTWNPYQDNDGLTKNEFLSLIKISKYKIVEFDGDWVTAYQECVNLYKVNNVTDYLRIAREQNLHIFSAMMEDESEKLRCLKIEYL